jgi:sulfur-oxidizing protein SoxY
LPEISIHAENHAMLDTRRTFLKICLALFGGIFFTPSARAAWPAEKFAPLKFPESLTRLLDGQTPELSDKIELKLPQIAENGAVVPISVSTALDNVASIAILVEKNVVPLVAQFDLSPECAPFVSARIKMAETCDVIAVVKAGGRYYSARQLVKVTIGGCGG